MKIVIIGLGKVGIALTEQLSKEGHDIVIIDQNPDILQGVQESFDTMAVIGNGAGMQVLLDAGADSADMVIAVTAADETNLLCCMTAKKLGCPHTIARMRNPEYTKQLMLLKDELGLSMAVNPEDSAAREMYHILQFPSFINRETFAKGRVEIVELKLVAGCAAIGKRLCELQQAVKVKVLVCAVERGDDVYIPAGDFQLKENDILHVTAETHDLATLMKNMKISTQKVKDVVLIGGSRIGFYLARKLIGAGMNVKIIEKNYDRCLWLSEYLPKAMVIHGDGCAQELLEEELHGKADAVVSLLNIDEVNLVISMYVSQLGVSKVVAKIDRTEYMNVYKQFGLESIISPRSLVCNDVLQYVRAMCNSKKSSAITLYRLINDRAEALEFRATKETKNLGVPFYKEPVRSGILIACIKRGSSILFPTGEDCIRLGDTVIVFTTAERTIRELNDIYR